MKNLYRSLRNLVDYPLRQYFKWQRPITGYKNESKGNLYAHLKGDERNQVEETAMRLKKSYPLQAFFKSSTADNYRENLYYLQMIETALDATGATLPPDIEAADIGVSHWFYVQALHAVLKRWGIEGDRKISLWGYEVDPYRIYSDFHSRYDHAMANISYLDSVNYVPHPFEKQPLRFELASMFFPFIFVADHLQWGLPGKKFNPHSLLADVWDSLTFDGILLVANQGLDEHQAQLEMFRDLDIPVVKAFEFKSSLYHFKHAHYVIVSVKPPKT